MKNKENVEINNKENAIEIVVGDSSELNISQVNDCMNSMRPKRTDKKNLIIPIAKKKISVNSEDKTKIKKKKIEN